MYLFYYLFIFIAMFITMFQPLYTSDGWNVKLSSLFLYFTNRGWLFMFIGCQLSPVYFHSENSALPSPGIELTLFFGYVTGSNQHLYPLYHVSLRTSVYEFLGIINLMSSATIFYQCSYCKFAVNIFFVFSILLKLIL